ncbi:hypothetical protein C5167_027583 [Papaver somniferum]|nr:hypothetical protein C5167_027583 [Papaver somniferum]
MLDEAKAANERRYFGITRRRVLIKLLIESPGPRSPGTKVSRYKGLQNRGLQDRGFGLCAWWAAAPCQADLPGWPLRPGGPMCLVCRWPGWPMRQVVSWEIELQYWTYSCELNKHQSAILYLASWLSPEDFTAKLSLRTIAGSLLKYLLKFQVDEEAAVRTNTILFGNIASYLNDGVSRHKGLQVHRSPEQRSPGTKFSRTVVSRTEASVSVPWRAAAPWRADVPVGPVDLLVRVKQAPEFKDNEGQVLVASRGISALKLEIDMEVNEDPHM